MTTRCSFIRDALYKAGILEVFGALLVTGILVFDDALKHGGVLDVIGAVTCCCVVTADDSLVYRFTFALRFAVMEWYPYIQQLASTSWCSIQAWRAVAERCSILFRLTIGHRVNNNQWSDYYAMWVPRCWSNESLTTSGFLEISGSLLYCFMTNNEPLKSYGILCRQGTITANGFIYCSVSLKT